MLFKFSKNPDGSYMIMTRASKDACFVEVVNASMENGGNIHQWVPTNHPCQNWNALVAPEEEANLKLNTVNTKIYKKDGFVHTVVFVK